MPETIQVGEMQVEKMESLPPNANPFNHDGYHMGTRMGKNILIMHPNFDSEECKYLIICNTDTGERIKIRFSPREFDFEPGDIADFWPNF